jgi:hypothetical protein
MLESLTKVIEVGLPKLSNRKTPLVIARWFVFKPKIPIWENFGGP